MNSRIITGLLLGGLIMLCIFYGNKYTSHLLLAINILGAWELAQMLRPNARSISVYGHILLSVAPYLILRSVGHRPYIFELLLFTSVLTGLILIIGLYKKTPYPYRQWSYALAFLYWGLPFSLGSYFLLESPVETNVIALGIIVLIWTTDTMAYFTGKRFGKTKLFESVSPNKTREGSLGAGVSSVVIASLYAASLEQPLMQWIAVGLIVWVIGTYGDLVESKMKRVAEVKDSGKLLPGHGGFLDRFDSLVMVIPFLLLLTLF